MAVYSPGFVISGDAIIGLAFIESIHLGINDDDKIVDKLRGDSQFKITTTSGKEYTLSMLEHMTKLKEYNIPSDINVIGQAILEKWGHIMENKCGNSSS